MAVWKLRNKDVRNFVVGILVTIVGGLALAMILSGPDPESQKVARDALLRGVVQDDSAKPVPGARVQLFGFGDESVLTDADGTFRLPAHVATGQEVRVKAERAGFESADQFQVVGDVVMTIRLSKASH